MRKRPSLLNYFRCQKQGCETPAFINYFGWHLCLAHAQEAARDQGVTNNK